MSGNLTHKNTKIKYQGIRLTHSKNILHFTSQIYSQFRNLFINSEYRHKRKAIKLKYVDSTQEIKHNLNLIIKKYKF